MPSIKFADCFEEGTFIVLRQPSEDLPVYVVQGEDSKRKQRTLHRNHLLPTGHLPVESLDEPGSEKKESLKLRLTRRPRKASMAATCNINFIH